MTIISTNISPTSARLGMTKRIAPSATNVFDDLLEFFCDVDPDVIPEPEKDQLIELLDDFEYLDKQQINEVLNEITEPVNANNWVDITEGKLKARHSSTPEKVRARRWYRDNKARVKSLALRLKKSKGKLKKKEIRKKSGRTLSGREKREYNTDGHEAVNLTLKRGARQAVDKLFEHEQYRVKSSFTIGEIDACLNEVIQHVSGNTFILCKRDGTRFQIEIDKKDIMPCLKKGDLTTEDIINARF